MPKASKTITQGAVAVHASAFGLLRSSGCGTQFFWRRTMERKRCSGCHGLKPLSEFHKDKAAKDGHRSCCKKCHCMRAAKYHANHKEKMRIRWARYFANHKEELRVKWRRYRETHQAAITKYKTAVRKTVKGRARSILAGNVYRGGVVKPLHCSACGLEVEKHLLQGHHDDYTKPLDVRWLCRPCHGLVHRKEIRSKKE